MTSPPSTGDDGPDAHGWTPPDPPAATPVPPVPAPAEEPPARTSRRPAIALGAGLVGLVLVGAGVFGVVRFTADEDGSPGRPVPKGMVAVASLQAGECLSGYTEDYSDPAAVRQPCDRGHNGEVGAKATLRDGAFPGAEGLRAQATDLCKERTAFLTKVPSAADIELKIALPGEDAWRKGEREATCVLVYTGPKPLVGPLGDTADARNTYRPHLEPGACIEKWHWRDDHHPVVECAESHQAQLYAKLTMPSGRYPGDRRLDDGANARCFARGLRVLTRLPKSAEMAYVRPDRESWEQGDRLVYCLVLSRSEPLRRSLMRRRK